MSSEISKFSKEIKVESQNSADRNMCLGWLRKVNDFLETIPTTVGAFFDNFFFSGEEMTQDAVDIVCTWIAWKVNVLVERPRQKVVRLLHEQNKDVSEMLAPVRFFVEAFRNPMSVLSAVVRVVKRIIKLFIGPYWYLVKFIKELTKEVIRLAENLTALSSMTPPNPPSPDIDFHAFSRNLKIGEMAMDIILDDPYNMPTPEEKFPEPYNPFSFKKNKDKGMTFWANATKRGKKDWEDTKVFYTVKNKESKNS